MVLFRPFWCRASKCKAFTPLNVHIFDAYSQAWGMNGRFSMETACRASFAGNCNGRRCSFRFLLHLAEAPRCRVGVDCLLESWVNYTVISHKKQEDEHGQKFDRSQNPPQQRRHLRPNKNTLSAPSALQTKTVRRSGTDSAATPRFSAPWRRRRLEKGNAQYPNMDLVSDRRL